MNKFYTEGLIDKDIFTQTGVQYAAKQGEGVVGMGAMAAPFVNMPNIMTEYNALIPLTSDTNSTQMWPQIDITVPGQFVVPKSSENIETAIKFANFFYTDAGRYLAYQGPGEKLDQDIAMGYAGFEIVDGNVMTVVDLPNDVASWWEYMNMYTSPINGPALGFVYSDVEISEMLDEEYAKDATTGDALWRASMIERVSPFFVSMFPNLYYTKEQTDTITRLQTSIMDYVAQMEARFIVGSEPLANFEDFQAELENLGVEEYIATLQESYDAVK